MASPFVSAMQTRTFFVHGFEFVRMGQCNQCGACGCGKGPCEHHYTEGGLHWCRIYGDHGSCVDFPNNPWVHVARDGVCGFVFRRMDGGSMDDLPFLDGSYRR